MIKLTRTELDVLTRFAQTVEKITGNVYLKNFIKTQDEVLEKLKKLPIKERKIIYHLFFSREVAEVVQKKLNLNRKSSIKNRKSK